MKIAIQGNPHLGSAIIQTLIDFGGTTNLLDGTNDSLYYYIDSNNMINCNYGCMLSKYKLVTWSEFIRKYPYNIRDVQDWIKKLKMLFNIEWNSIENMKNDLKEIYDC